MRLRGKGIFVLGRVFFLLDLMLFLNSADISLWLQSGYKPLNGGCDLWGRLGEAAGSFGVSVDMGVQPHKNMSVGWVTIMIDVPLCSYVEPGNFHHHYGQSPRRITAKFGLLLAA